MARVLVVGSGGREHALCYAFHQSPQVETVYVAPGNPGMRDVATPIPVPVHDFDGLIAFAKQHQVDLTFVGPEVPLVNGIADAFEAAGLKVFGPRKNAAVLEGSKAFSKDMMKRYHIPTATFEVFTDVEQAKQYIRTCSFPLVLKADGLAAGKGVIIAQTIEEALQAADDMMCHHLFQEAGATLVIEEYLEGEEFSLMALVHGEHVYPLPIAQDHKRAYDGDMGPNTGGMGSYTPVAHLPATAVSEAMERIMIPMCKAMVAEGRPYQGVLYGGLMLTKDGVKTIEFNCRFGDPETEVILQALQGDFYQICVDVLADREPQFHVSDQTYLGLVMASSGYPQSSTSNALIEGITETAPAIFHMGTAETNGQYVTHGGRVLFVSGSGNSIEEAYHNAYQRAASIHCDKLFYRKDIGFHAKNRK